MQFGMKAGLENMAALCAEWGNPQQGLRIIHVVGTNGKGSTSYWLMRILEAHGLRVGLFTSPHLVSLRERIRVGDTAIPLADLERLVERVRTSAGDREVTFFEVLTAVAILWFAELKLDVVVLEAGLGGRLDSTNICFAPLCVLTSIGLDHTEILGDSPRQILREKLGVWKAGATLLHRLQDAELLEELQGYEKSIQNAHCVRVPVYQELRLAQAGDVYRENASLSLEAARRYLGELFDEGLALRTLQGAVWAGRQQELWNPVSRYLEWILDGCHNGHAALRLAETLQKYYPGQRFPLVLAILQTKSPIEIITPLLPHISSVFLTRTPHPKMRDPAELVGLFATVPVKVFSTVSDALDAAGALPGPKLCTGSLYFVGAVIEAFKDQYSELAWFRQFTPDDNERR